MLQLYIVLIAKSLQRTELVDHIGPCLIGTHRHLAASKAHQIWISRMGPYGYALLLAHLNGGLHDERITGMPTTSHIGTRDVI